MGPRSRVSWPSIRPAAPAACWIKSLTPTCRPVWPRCPLLRTWIRTISFRPTEAGPRYRVLRPHAEGGLGEVFVAEDQELHREVALKEIKKEYAREEVSRGRFVQEAEITGGLEHPGIVPVYGLGTYADGRPFYAMRFIKGDNLKAAIERFHATEPVRFDSLEFRQLLGRFVDVCQAVAYAHSRGVLHRDLKPGNIMLGKFGETLVVDWGLAKVVGRSDGDIAGRQRRSDAAAEFRERVGRNRPGQRDRDAGVHEPGAGGGEVGRVGSGDRRVQSGRDAVHALDQSPAV